MIGHMFILMMVYSYSTCYRHEFWMLTDPGGPKDFSIEGAVVPGHLLFSN